jgi:hypothetical protein
MDSQMNLHHRRVRGMDHKRIWKGEVSWTCLLEGGARGLLENRKHLARIVEVSYFFVKLIRSGTV